MTGSQMILGLDLGVTSVGWALLGQNEGSTSPNNIVATGVRIFPATIEDKTAAPKNLKRRTARRASRAASKAAAKAKGQGIVDGERPLA